MIENEVTFIADQVLVLIKVLVHDPAIKTLAQVKLLRTKMCQSLPFAHRFDDDPIEEECHAFEWALITGEPLTLKYFLRYLGTQQQVEDALKGLGFTEIVE